MSHLRFLRTAASLSRPRASLFLASGIVTPSVRARAGESVRTYATGESKSAGSTALWWGVGILGAGAGYYFYSTSQSVKPLSVPPVTSAKKPIDYAEVYKAIANTLEENEAYDDGNYGPLLVRLAWHSSGTFDKNDGSGGSNHATMRFEGEGGHAANAGLLIARDHLEKIKQKFPEISYGDLWTLAGVVAVQEMGGPKIPWRPGRIDGYEADSTPDGRLPDAALGQDHIRSIFYRMGFGDQEIVALLGAHALGRCHEDRSGFSGPWTPSPTMFTNDFYNQLATKKWVEKKWKGPKQYEDKETKELMMLPSDIALLKDKNFKKYVELYAKDNDKFFEDFAKVYKKLLELGVKFPEGTKEYVFPTLNA